MALKWKNNIQIALAILTLLIVFLQAQSPAYAQVKEKRDSYFEQNIQPRKFDNDKWKKQTSGLEYHEKIKDKSSSSKGLNLPKSPVQSKSIMIVIMILTVGILAFILYKLIGKNLFVKLPKKENTDFRLSELDDSFDFTDLERKLREAVSDGNLRQIVRVKYLMILRALSSSGYIYLKREKTNNEYLQELKGEELKKPFAESTKYFDQIWYGNQPISAIEFQRIDPLFSGFITQLNKSGGNE